MKLRITALVIAIVLLLTGCVQPETPEVEQEINLGTISENFGKGNGRFAMSNGLVYITEENGSYVIEFDLETGKSRTIPMRNDEPFQANGARKEDFRTFSNLFLLPSGIGFIEVCNENYNYRDENGKILQVGRIIQTFSILDYDGRQSTPIPEMGEQVYTVIPVKKVSSENDTSDELESESDEANPLAGLEFYYYFGYDTFPEMQEQGLVMEEPTDPNERNRYYVPSLGYMDGDTRKTEVLLRGIGGSGVFNVDDKYLYVLQGGVNTGLQLYRSERGSIDFQKIDLGSSIGAPFSCHDGGVFFFRAESWQVCYYKDGAVTELPIVSSAFIPWKDCLIYHDSHWQDTEKYGPIKSYNLNTGEIKTLIEDTEPYLSILEDGYLACHQHTEAYRADVLVNLETGEQTELRRVGN